MRKRLMLIDIKKVNFKDGAIKMKHVFLDADNKVLLGWADEGEELSAEHVVSSDRFSEERANEFEVDVNEYDGKMTYRVDLTLLTSQDT